MAVTRTIYATIEIACCRDGDEVYHPLPRQIIAPQTKPYFDETLDEWVSRARAALDAKYRAIAEDECRGMGTPRLCLFRLTVDDWTETGEPERKPCPRDVIGRLERIEDMIGEAETDDERTALEEERDRIIADYRERGYEC